VVRYTFPLDATYEFQLRLQRDRNEHVEGLYGPNGVETRTWRRAGRYSEPPFHRACRVEARRSAPLVSGPAEGDGIAARSAGRGPDRQPADLLGRRQVSPRVRGREIADSHIIEAMAGFIARQKRSTVELDRKKVANGVLVFVRLRRRNVSVRPGLGLAAAAASREVSSEATTAS